MCGSKLLCDAFIKTLCLGAKILNHLETLALLGRDYREITQRIIPPDLRGKIERDIVETGN